MNRDLDHCHHQMKQQNLLLTDKKKDILMYQDQIASMRAEMAELREISMSGVREGVGEGGREGGREGGFISGEGSIRMNDSY